MFYFLLTVSSFDLTTEYQINQHYASSCLLMNILDVPESSSQVQLQTNESCVFVTAKAPLVPNGIIINYTVSIVEIIFLLMIQSVLLNNICGVIK